jgi:hypothetical protein
MNQHRYSPHYRESEVRTIAGWIEAGESGAVVGMAGAGKSNLLKFLCAYPHAFSQYFTNPDQVVVPVPVDLNNLPAYDISTFYRLILRSFFEAVEAFDAKLRKPITEFYRDTMKAQDPFLPQSALRELFFLLQAEQVKVVLILDRFDRFCEVATPQMFDTLRGFRDTFKQTLSYIIGLRYEVDFLPEPEKLGELHELLDLHTCWVQPLREADARQFIQEEIETAPEPPTDIEIETMLNLTGGYPALLKATCYWWRTTANRPAVDGWPAALGQEQSIQNRLMELWSDLTQEEQLTLSDLAKENVETPSKQDMADHHRYALTRLAAKGLCQHHNGVWSIKGKLLEDFAAGVKEQALGRIWWNEQSNTFWQGSTQLDLSPQQQAILHYFMENAHRRLTKTDLIMHLWPDEWEEVDETRLYTLVRQLRRKLDPQPTQPRYIVNWRGTPEGGYQFFPEGRAG